MTLCSTAFHFFTWFIFTVFIDSMAQWTISPVKLKLYGFNMSNEIYIMKYTVMLWLEWNG